MIPIISRPGAFNSPVISPIYINNPLSSIYPKIRVNFTRQRRGIQASPLVLPLLPFPIQQVLVPSEAKTIHLYEARYLALLEESLLKNKVFVHFVLDPTVFGGTSIEGSFSARYGCLVFIEKVEQLQIGALVSIRGVGRVQILGFKQEYSMVRSKIRYELIADERARRETFRKRKPGLFKKLNELKTLCNVEACAIVYHGDETQPETWPSLDEASRVVQKFKNLPSSLQTIHMVNQEGFLMQNLARLEKNLGNENKKIDSLEKKLLLARSLNNAELDVSNSDDLRELLCLLERRIQMITHKISNIETSDSTMVAGGVKASRLESHDGKLKQPI